MPKTSLWISTSLGMICCFPAHAQVHAEPDRLGDALQYAVPLAAAALSWVHQDTPGLQQLGATLLLSQTTTEVLKHAANSPRPDGTGRGFPSGHASLAFASAGYVRQRYGWRESAPFYALASSMAWTRVHTHHHFTKDVIGGALVGEASSILVARWMGPRQSAAVSYGTQGVWVSYTQEF